MDPVAFKRGQRQLWGKGNWSEVAKRLQPVANRLVAAAGVPPGSRVLDVAAGDGNVASAAAAIDARVIASDLNSDLITMGRERTLGMPVVWCGADIEILPFPDSTFDFVLSTFGVMYAPDREKAVAEMFRVAVPGGVVAVANWMRQGWQGRLASVMVKHVPPPKGRLDPLDWGEPEKVTELFSPHTEELSFERNVLWDEFASVEAWWEKAQVNSPPLASIKETKTAEEFEALGRDLMAEAAAVADPPGTARWASNYLIVVATKPGT